jgi:hypothetical protein
MQSIKTIQKLQSSLQRCASTCKLKLYVSLSAFSILLQAKFGWLHLLEAE